MRELRKSHEIYDAVEAGGKYKELAEIYNVPWVMIRSIYLDTHSRINRHGDLYGLHSLTVHTLLRNGITTKRHARELVQSKRIYPRCFRNFGLTGYVNLCDFLGVEVIEDEDKKQNAINKHIKFLENNGYQVTLK
tara:strand:+ start:260 stop:664 length:405 start_codon:yes stop_codon:yes gene_type:complete